MAKLFKLLSVQILIVSVGLELLLNIFLPFPDPYKSVEGFTKYHKFLPAWNLGDREPPHTSVFVAGPLHGVSTRKVTVSVNRFGFFYDETAGHRTQKDELRIGVIGGSTVECLVLENERRWPNQLQHYLANSFPGRLVTVLNMGRSGQDTRTHLASVAQLAVKLQLDYLVFMLGGTDLRRTSGEFQPLTDDSAFLPVVVGTDRGFFKVLASRFQLGRALRLSIHRFQGWSEPSADESIPYFQSALDKGKDIPIKPDPQTPISSEALADYESNLISLFSLASAHGITPIFTTQPSLWKPTMTADEEAVDWSRLGVIGDRTPAYRLSSAEVARNMDALNQRLMSVCNERGWRCIDLASKIPRSLDYFYDSVHFNEAGAEFVAKEVAQFLTR
jgi:lysophospholipase L1-like esterase